MKIAVIGAGALGTLLGGLLAAGDDEVWLLHHRESVATAIEADGVRIEDVDGTVTERRGVRATTDAADVGEADLAIVVVRSYQTIAAVTEHDACIGAETRVLSLQNGLANHHRLREHLGPEHTLNGVAYTGASLSAPGRVVRTSRGRVVFGGPDGTFAARVAETFEAAGIEAEVVADPFVPIWRKQLFGGAIKPVAALTRLPNRELVAAEGTVHVMEQLVMEAGGVAEARGVAVDPEAVFDDLAAALADSTHTSSMLQDVEAGRRTEVDDVNGAVVDLAAEAGIDVPYNRMATALVRGLERGYLADGD